MEATSLPGSDELYRAAVGESKADYYVPKFLNFDTPGAGRLSWNWPAFFITFLWMLYRRMYGYALLYVLAWPIVLLIVGFAALQLLGERTGTLVYVLVALAVPFGVIPMYANALYHRRIKKNVAELAAAAPSREALVQRLIGQSSVSGAGLIATIVIVLFVPVTGILAAIAIPAYQDYTIRAQVTEGLMLASPVKVAIAESFADRKAWPADLRDAGLDAGDYRGKYVDSIVVENGTIFILYGGTAHRLIADRTLTLRPAVTAADEISWSCGHSQGAGDDPASGPSAAHQTDIAPKYLPASCRK